MKKKFPILAIIFLATILRIFNLSSNPPSLYWEEAALGYDAYSILKTGKDYHGNFLPIVSFPSFGDYKPSLYFYAIVPFMAIFGPTNLAIRLPSAIAGILAVLVVYLISKQLKLSGKTSLLSAFLLSISPWHLQFSRAGFEVNLSTTIYLTGIYYLLKSKTNHRNIYLSAILLSLSMYAYHGFRIIAPISALVIYLFYKKSIRPKYVITSLAIAFIASLPILVNITKPTVNQRLKETSYFSTSNVIETTNHLRETSGNTLISRIIFHRYWFWTGDLVNNYLQNFSPKFLFLTGDNNQRHGVGEFGPLYHWEIITISLGLLLLIKSKSQNKKILLSLLLVTPLATMLTKTNPHTLRLLAAAPYFAIISSIGLSHLNKVINYKKVFLSIAFVIIFIEAATYLHFYWVHYPTISQKDWQYGYKQAVEFTNEVKDNYDHIYFTREYGRPSIYVLFYQQIDPAYIQSIEPTLKKDQLELLEFGKYKFGNTQEPKPNSLVVTSPNEIKNKEINRIKTIHFLNGEDAFVIYEI